ncbi:MAG: porphobilinogen synthase [Chloroflexi bacterium]|nr:porphobilinogen synthase [Chloroflexota bacterium]
MEEEINVGFPQERLRRLRLNPALRGLVQETRLSVSHLIYPLFVVPGRGVKDEIASMPGCYHLSVDQAVVEGEAVAVLGIPGVLLFGIPPSKDPLATQAYHPQGIVQEAIRTLKKEIPQLLVITDVCLCEYTSHGHCGVLVDGEVDNDKSLELIAQAALSHAQAGADMVAPSAMMDGQVAAIRRLLDERGLVSLPIMSYAAKYASAFYGPFREAAESAPQQGDRRGYQMDPPNVREALREIALDIEEGADIVMVKPALAYLDVIARARQAFHHPLAAYNVSGEYAMLKAAVERGWLEERAIMEVLTAIKRAGADIIITYHAKEVASLLGR